MFGQKRLAKRSIIGTRISGMWQDGRLYPGVIEDVNKLSNGQSIYTVRFDDGHTKNLRDTELVGQGFGQISNFTLKHGQKVYLTFNGREVSGVIVKHNRETDDALVSIHHIEGHEQKLYRRIDEIRLTESRKSSRLDNHRDTDYSKLADLNLHDARKRNVSHVIDVPDASNGRGHRKDNDDSEEMEMDEHMAAMVLTALSCSPTSPVIPSHMTLDFTMGSPDSFLSTSAKSSSPSPRPSPPAHMMHLSNSVPSGLMFGCSSFDEGIDMEVMSEDESSPKKRKGPTKMLYKCTWPGCQITNSSCKEMEQHVRNVHLGPRKYADSDELSDHEEEFYYTEVEVNVDSMTETFAQMYTSSPPGPSRMRGSFSDHESSRSTDHDYQRKMPKFHIPEDAFVSHFSTIHEEQRPPTQSTGPINIPVKCTLHPSSLSPTSAPNMGPQSHDYWQHSPSPKSQSYSSSPKHISHLHKKPRSEVKKCRKVYGMENRDLWCTQCKWKKACSRFVE